MSLIDSKSWWEENQVGTLRLVAICSLVALALVVILFHSEIKGFFSSHSWWEDALVALAGITAPVLAYFELRHSGEANQLRRAANDLRANANRLQARVTELEEEKAGYLAQIATNTQRPVSEAERNAAILRRYLGTTTVISEGRGVGIWNTSPLIADVSEDNVVALFSPRSSSSAARCVHARCEDLEIVELPNGPPQLKVLKRYGDVILLGDITKWEDRHRSLGVPMFDKGDVAFHSRFSKPGSSETRSLAVFTSKDGSNSFLLETGAGEQMVDDNVGISKLFMSFEVDYRAEGFNRTSSGTDSTSYPLYIR